MKLKDLTKEIIGKKILLIIAHPDDESFLAAGTLHLNYEAGGTNIVVCATKGERGTSYLEEHMTEKGMKAIRKKELRAASEILGVDKLVHLDFPDCGLGNFITEYYEQILGLADIQNIEVVVSFGPDGVSGHLDHIAAYKTTKKIAQQIKKPWYVICPGPQFVANKNHIDEGRRKGQYADEVVYQKPEYKIEVDSAIKKKAILCHVSQFKEGNLFRTMPDNVSQELLSVEYYRKGI